MTKDEVINGLMDSSYSGTDLRDMEAAYSAGERAALHRLFEAAHKDIDSGSYTYSVNLGTSGDSIQKQNALIAQLKESLAYAIKEADGWYDDLRGGLIESDEMDKARALLNT